MPIHGYPGNVITANPTAPTVSSASGVWTTEQQLINQSAGRWPMAATQVSLSTRFNSADSAYLSRTPASASNRDTWTLSFWIKRTNLGEQYIFSVADGSASGFEMRFTSGDALRVNDYNPGVTDYIFLITSQLFRDVGAWYHIVLAVDTTQATNTNRVKIYVNGSQVTAFSSTTYPNQNQDTAVNTAKQHRFGAAPSSTPPTTFGNFYLAEVNFIDGLALDPSYFGFNDSNTGAWTPKQYTGAYGTNGFFLPFNKEGVSVDFLVVAGGAGGSIRGGAGGGGYRTSVGTSGGGASAESALVISTGVAYTVTVGAGGSSGNGSNSVLSGITSIGGGFGPITGNANSGGSGGGGGTSNGLGGAGTTGQGFAGGRGFTDGSSFTSCGGGGGAGSAGANGGNPGAGGNGGNGVTSSISGSSITYAGGTGGWGDTYGSGSNGTGSGNTANRGGGSSTSPGGSGVVIIKIPDTYTATFSGGVTQTSATSGGFKTYIVTATSTTSETVTFS
jgi:hypothetical protein